MKNMSKNIGRNIVDNEYFQRQVESMRSSITAELAHVRKYFRGNWIIDVGSNVGAFIDCALQTFPGCTILAFEPVSSYYFYTVDRFLDNDNVYLENLALSDRNGTENIFVATKNIGWNTMVREMVDEDNEKQIEIIDTASLDSYLDYVGLNDISVDIIKIDTEGFEYKVISGMQRFLQTQKPAILCEIGWGKKHPFWNEELIAFDYLYGLGYKTIGDIAIENLEGTTDVIFIYEG